MRVGPGWIGLTALIVLFGLESLRALMPLTVFVLRDRFGWHAAAVGLAMLAVLATGFLATPCCRAFGVRRFLLFAAGGLGLARLALQAWTGDPLGDLGLAAVATIFFFFALPTLASAADRSVFVFGWWIGLAADTALHGAYRTWDMSWRSDLATLLTVLGLVALQWLLLRAVGQSRGLSSPGPRSDWPWIALGPWLFLELLVLGNVARLTTLTGWKIEAATLWVLVGRILALAAVARLMVRERRLAWPAVASLTLALAASLMIGWPRGYLAALLLLAGQIVAALLWSTVLLGVDRDGDSTRRLAWSHGVSLVAFGVLLFLYYGSIDIRLPFNKDLLPSVAALVVGAAALAVVRSVAAERRARDWRPPGYAWLAPSVLLAPALLQLAAAPGSARVVRSQQPVADPPGFSLRIMTYNLHLGIDPRGHLGLEHIAATIDTERPDVVALQEVARGWAIGGNVDVLAWLSRRLGMPYVFAATADPLWGNALLSRQPILEFEAIDLPSSGLLIQRGLLAARIDVGESDPFRIIVTHHHHKRHDGAIRELQSRAILDHWQGAPRTAILGDFNGRPGEPEIEMLRVAGLRDVLAVAGIEPGYTSPAIRPMQRIDYIWISPDLTASEVSVPQARASDHLPVVATLSPNTSG